MVSYFQALIGLVGLGCSTVLTVGLISDHAAHRSQTALVPVCHLSLDRGNTTPSQDPENDSVAATVVPAEWEADPYADGEPVAAPQVAARNSTKEPRSAATDGQKRAARTLKRVCRVTAYCDRGITASGVDSGVGQCAAPADIPFGSKIYVPKLNRTFLVTDRTHKRFRKSTVDLFMPGKTQCLDFGRHYLDVVITLPEKPWKRPKGR